MLELIDALPDIGVSAPPRESAPPVMPLAVEAGKTLDSFPGWLARSNVRSTPEKPDTGQALLVSCAAASVGAPLSFCVSASAPGLLASGWLESIGAPASKFGEPSLPGYGAASIPSPATVSGTGSSSALEPTAQAGTSGDKKNSSRAARRKTAKP